MHVDTRTDRGQPDAITSGPTDTLQDPLQRYSMQDDMGQSSLAVIQRLPATEGLPRGTVLMDVELGVVAVIKGYSGGYFVMDTSDKVYKRPLANLDTSVSAQGAEWEFGMALPSRLLAAATALEEDMGDIGDETWVPDLHKVMVRLLNEIRPEPIPIPVLHPPEYLAEISDILGSEAPNAQFDHKDWSVAIAPAMFERPKKEALAELAGDLYHELRHAEQYYVAARVLARDWLTSPDRLDHAPSAEQYIVDTLGISPEVARAAAKSAASWEATETDLDDGAKLAQSLVDTLDRAAKAKLAQFKLSLIQDEGAKKLKEIAADEENLRKLANEEPPFDKLPSEHVRSTHEMFTRHLEVHRKEFEGIRLREEAARLEVNFNQKSYFGDPTERDAARLGKVFEHGFRALTGIGGSSTEDAWDTSLGSKGPTKKRKHEKPSKVLPVDPKGYAEVILKIRSTLGSLQDQHGVNGQVWGGYPLTQQQVQTLNNRRLLPTVPDGDCAINAVFESLGRTGDPRLLRAQIANLAIQQDLVDPEAADSMLQPGDWTLSDVALHVMATALRIRIRIVEADGGLRDIAPPEHDQTIVLVHVGGALPHFYGTR